MASFKELQITWQFLDNNPSSYVVFGDNLQKCGKGGAAVLRDHPHALGFITKKFPDNNDGSFYRPEEYQPIFDEQLEKFVKLVKANPTKTFYFTKLGAGLANRYQIWEKVINNKLVKTFEKFENVIFCWNNK